MVSASATPFDANPVEPAATLVDLLRLRAQHEPAKVTHRFLREGGGDGGSRTAAEADRRARAVAALLQTSGVGPGERVLLLYPQGLDYVTAFFGCLYAGTVPIPVYALRMNRPMPRLEAIVADARAAAALTSATLLEQARPHLPQTPTLHALQWLAGDAVPPGIEDAWKPPGVGPDDLALLQYTSGSTAAPKGVMLTHANVMHNMAMARRGFACGPGTRGVCWLPPHHDMGFMAGVVMPIYAGFPVNLLSPLEFLQRPVRWLEAISQARATHTGAPNFAYDLCARKVTPEQRARLDLSSLEVAFVGAEPVQAETLRRFAEAFAPCGFRKEAFLPCYGLAEATVFVTGNPPHAAPVVHAADAAALEAKRVASAPADDPRARLLVGCGRTGLGGKVLIVDPETWTPCPAGRVGEVWVSGGQVGKGYWNRPAETEQTFGARLAGTGEGPFLRTGDLGYLHGEQLFITGRLKDLLIIRGKNHYPQDIEQTVEQSHPVLRPTCGAAFAVDVGGEERLVVVQEMERHGRAVDRDEVVRAIRRAVAEHHDLQVHAVVLLRPASIPKTSSGKIQRHACRAGYLDGSLREWET